LRIGHLGVSRSHPDFPALLVCNAILGGSFNSRINMNLREEKGYTYGARSTFELERSPGAFVVATAVETSVTTAAIREVIREIETIRDADVTTQELDAAKNRYTAALPGHFQTAGAIATTVAGLYTHDLPLDTYWRLPPAIRAVTVADVRRVATALLHPEKLSVVVVGDAEAISPGLERLQRGPLQHRTPNGELSAPDSVPARHERD
jgi:predicted Zn-dependent peptidase